MTELIVIIILGLQCFFTGVLVKRFTPKKKPPTDFLTLLKDEIPLEAFLSEDLSKQDFESGYHALLSIQDGLKKSVKKYNGTQKT